MPAEQCSTNTKWMFWIVVRTRNELKRRPWTDSSREFCLLRLLHSIFSTKLGGSPWPLVSRLGNTGGKGLCLAQNCDFLLWRLTSNRFHFLISNSFPRSPNQGREICSNSQEMGPKGLSKCLYLILLARYSPETFKALYFWPWNSNL